MKSWLSLAAACSALLIFSARATTTHYVDVNGTNPVSPYASWTTAATNIQDAVDVAASSGDAVLVTNGIYQTGTRTISGVNRVAVDSKTVSIQSVNGPSVTIIKGAWDSATNGPNAVRCVYLAGNSTLSGFTLTNGATAVNGSGGGVYAISTNCVVANCMIVGNAAYTSGGGARSCTLNNCVLSGNAAHLGGGFGEGGGTEFCTVNNCLLAGNSATYGSGANGGSLNNCTIILNSGSTTAANGSTLVNSIIFYNSNASGYADCYQCQLTSCCTTLGFGNTTLPSNCTSNPPAFVDIANGNFHLQVFSPCINTGTNLFAPTGTDLDGNPRIVGGTVDMGAYESQNTIPVHYVWASNTAPVSPFTNWLTAATNIQAAIDAAAAGDYVVVSNGTYKTGGRAVYGAETNRVVLSNAVTVMSVNGPTNTLIIGGPQMRCVYVGSNSLLSGFTLTNGQTRSIGDITNEQSGNGAWCEVGGVISNCVVTHNFNSSLSGGKGGGVYGGTIWNSTILTNTAYYGAGLAAAAAFNCQIQNNSVSPSGTAAGGGAYFCTLSNCQIIGNGWDGNGAGVYNSTLVACLVSNNSTLYVGGGAYNSSLNNCRITGNRAGQGGGANACILNNCLIYSNNAIAGAGGAFGGVLNNCIVAGNYCANNSSAAGGINGSAVSNCIIYYNNSPSISNYTGNPTLNYCCTWPMPTNGLGNFTNAPLFVNFTNDFHLLSNSPCINAGNNVSVTNSTDFEGNARIVGGTVDIGAYEYQTPSSILSYAWAQQYGLPTDGTADNLDADGDGMKNWQEWKAATVPTNATSVLQLASPTNSPSGVTVTWQSVTNVIYYLQRSTNLPAFTSIQSNIVGQMGTTIYTDTTATNSDSYFYRVGVQ